MAIYEHITEFAGKTVVDWDAENGVADPQETIVRIGIDWDEDEADVKWIDKFVSYLDHPASAGATGLVVGAWDGLGEMDGHVEEIVESVVAARERLANLNALYFGEVVSEECEISWIRQTDISPLFTAYPNLEYCAVRGGTELSLGKPRLPLLRSLIVETGGMTSAVLNEILQADLPVLEHLELWLGTERYGGTVTLEDLEPLLSGNLFPSVKYLGLRNSDIADAIAAAIANAPILERIETLDLSLGTLGDEGAEALLASPYLAKLKKLDLHHHYCSEAMTARLQALSIEVDADGREDEDKYGRYVNSGE